MNTNTNAQQVMYLTRTPCDVALDRLKTRSSTRNVRPLFLTCAFLDVKNPSKPFVTVPKAVHSACPQYSLSNS